MWKLIRLFLLEEIRLRRSFSSSLSLIIFPEIILIGSMGGYIFLPYSDIIFTYDDIHSAILASLFLFGVSMGGIAFLGKDLIERSLGPVTMMAASAKYQPVGEKKMYLAYFFHDVLFYLILVLFPMTFGLLLGMMVEPMPINRFLVITSAQWLTFMMGLSLSMFVSSLLNNKRRILLLLIPSSIVPLVMFQIITSEVEAFIPGIMALRNDSVIWIVAGSILTVVYVISGTLAFEGSSGSSKNTATGSYYEFIRFASFLYPKDGSSRTLLAREMLGLIRGKAYIRIGFSILFPLLVISGLIGLISGLEGIPLTLNLTFFAVMVSFFTISIYTHLTNIDFLDFDQTVPISTSQVIKVKLRLFLILGLPISLLFLVTMSIAIGDFKGLLFGIPLILVAVPYMGYVTAYLTGLWTNSLIFDSSVFMKYMLFTALPLMLATLLSLIAADRFLPAMIGISTVIISGSIAILVFSRAMDEKWKKTVLSSSGQGFKE